MILNFEACEGLDTSLLMGQSTSATTSESVESIGPVNLQQLTGLHDLWKHHDLNLQGDASHFVNSLWLLPQSRAFTYRYAAIHKDHVQMPVHVPFFGRVSS